MSAILTINTGSSSFKWTLFHGDVLSLRGEAPWTSAHLPSRAAQISATLSSLPPFSAVGHRFVHGGLRFHRPEVLRGSPEARSEDEALRKALNTLTELDPEHLPTSLTAVDAVSAHFPGTPQVLVFDTAFHRTIPEAAAGDAIPAAWVERWGLHRYGFHGLSVSYATERTAELLGRMPGKMVVCHLGSGCSITAVEKGRSVATTMGFSPTDGVMMATRSGALDPSLILYLQEQCGLSAGELREALTKQSGILGVSGISGDLREVLGAAAEGSPRAQLAYDRFVHSLRRAVGGMVAVLGGVDVMVFTGGMGENSAQLRRDVTSAFAYAGFAAAMESGDHDRITSARRSAIAVLVIRAREDLVLYRAVRQAVPVP
jgi:acetate kinase